MTAIWAWVVKNPLLAVLLAMTVVLLIYRAQAIYFKDEAEIARTEAAGAKKAVSQVKGREKAIIALESRQRQEEQDDEALIARRAYFDAH